MPHPSSEPGSTITDHRPADTDTHHDIAGSSIPRNDRADTGSADGGIGIRFDALSGPGWLAATGAALLLIASIIVVAGNWETITPEVRFAGLVASLVAIYFAAEAGRTRLPSTSAALAFLAACVTAPVGIAAAATLSQTWPVCVFVGGVCALVAAEAQARRWEQQTLRAMTVLAFGLATVGLAAITEIPVAMFGAFGAVIFLLAGAGRRSVALAGAAAITPWVAALADAGIGVGTIDRIGVTGTSLVWSAPIVSAIAAAVIANRAHRTNNAALAMSAVAALWIGVVTGLDAGAAPGHLWLTMPILALLAVETVAAIGPSSIFRDLARRVAFASTSIAAIVGVTAPLLTVLDRLLNEAFATTASDAIWSGSALPLGLAVVAFAAGTIGSARRSTSVFAPIVPLAGAGTAVALLTVLGVPLLWIGVSALAGWTMTTAAIARTIGTTDRMSGEATSTWAAPRAWVPVTLAHVVWALAAAFSDSAATPGQLVAIVVAASAVMLVALTASPRRIVYTVGIPSTFLTATAMLAGVAPDDFAPIAAFLAIIAVATTGVAMMTSRLGPIDVIALSASVTGLIVAIDPGGAAVSLSLMLLAAQGVLYGVALTNRSLTAAAATVGFVSALSLWWTTGTNQLAIEWLAPYGIDGQDLALGATSIGLGLAGFALRRTTGSSTWLAYGPALAMTFAWLLPAQTEIGADWATIIALVIGVTVTAVGGIRHLGAPLVIGTIGSGATLVISAGPRLAAAPTWTWIAAGGAALIVTAALIERSDRPLLPSNERTDGPESLVDAFRRDFA